MRHLIGLLSVDLILYGIRYCSSMLAISNFGIAFKKAQIGYLKEKDPKWDPKTIISIAL